MFTNNLKKRLEQEILKNKISLYEMIAGPPKGWSDNLVLRTPEEKLIILEKK